MLLDKNIPLGYILNQIKYEVLIVLGLSASFVTLKQYYGHYIPDIPIALPSVLGTAISLLLAFKLNQSYDRWWEARKVWGAIVNDSRSLVLQLQGFTVDSGDTFALIKQMAYRQIAWCYCLGGALRGKNVMERLDELLAGDEIIELQKHANKPLALLALHMRDLKELHAGKLINDYQQLQIDSTLVRCCESMGKCERINNTVFPATYRKFLHLFIYLFLVILSASLLETLGVYEIPLLVLIASAFFLIEKTATLMQDPFKNRPTDTAVTAIARTIEINIRQLLGETVIPKPLEARKFYLL